MSGEHDLAGPATVLVGIVTLALAVASYAAGSAVLAGLYAGLGLALALDCTGGPER